MIWATVQEVRDELGADLPPASDLPDSAVQRLIDRSVRTLTGSVIRWPILDEDDRPEDEEQRGHVVAAVAETVRAIRESAAFAKSLNGAGVVLAAGGSISASKLAVGGGRGVRISSGTVPFTSEAYDALLAAGMVGGPVATW